MVPLDRLLREELSRTLERIAGAAVKGNLRFVTARHPGLRSRLEEAEARLAGLREELLARHAVWQAALLDLEDLWALAALKRQEPARPTSPLRAEGQGEGLPSAEEAA